MGTNGMPDALEESHIQAAVIDSVGSVPVQEPAQEPSEPPKPDAWSDFEPYGPNNMFRCAPRGLPQHISNEWKVGNPGALPEEPPVCHPMICRYWFAGRVCKSMMQNRCGPRHPETIHAVDMLHPLLCHRFQRGTCSQQRCHHLHMTREEFRAAKSWMPEPVQTGNAEAKPCINIIDPKSAILDIMTTFFDKYKNDPDKQLLMAENWTKVFHPEAWDEIEPPRLRFLFTDIFVEASGMAAKAKVNTLLYRCDRSSGSKGSQGPP